MDMEGKSVEWSRDKMNDQEEVRVYMIRITYLPS